MGERAVNIIFLRGLLTYSEIFIRMLVAWNCQDFEIYTRHLSPGALVTWDQVGGDQRASERERERALFQWWCPERSVRCLHSFSLGFKLKTFNTPGFTGWFMLFYYFLLFCFLYCCISECFYHLFYFWMLILLHAALYTFKWKSSLEFF